MGLATVHGIVHEHGERITQRDVEAAGIRALLHKPVEPDVLCELLRTHLH